MMFDTRTVFLMIGLLCLVMATTVWMVLSRQRTLAVNLWCGGGLLMASSTLLISLHDHLPDPLTVTLANLLGFVSLIATIQSLRLDLGKPLRLGWALFVAVAFVSMFEYLRTELADGHLLILFKLAVFLLLASYLAWCAWHLGRARDCHGAFWISGAYSLLAAGLLFRLIAMLCRLISIDLLGYCEALSAADDLANSVSAFLLPLLWVMTTPVGHIGYLGMALERSMRREAEAAAAQARLEEIHRLSDQITQMDRLRCLGEWSASLGHKLNQPLAAILANAQVALRGLTADRFDRTQLADFLDKIIQNNRRASQITKQISQFIDPAVARCEPVDLDQIVHEVAELVAGEANKYQIAFLFSSLKSRVLVSGDPIRLSQILLHVLRNAVEALIAAPRRKIRIDLVARDGRVILRVRDTGPGLSPEGLAQAGTLFFTTKPTGLGMGLVISSAIAQQQGGSLVIANAEGGGALVELNLPALPEFGRV
ncbi:GHKL domain-containing protein [Gammaproteobacteria bacterium]